MVATDRDVDRLAVVDQIRQWYRAAGLRWHARVVWVPSPLVAMLVVPVLARWHTGPMGHVRAALRPVGRGFDGYLMFLAAGVGVLYIPGLVVATLVFGGLTPWLGGGRGPFPQPGHGAWTGAVAGGLVAAAVLMMIAHRFPRANPRLITTMPLAAAAFVGAWIGGLLDDSGAAPPIWWIAVLLVAVVPAPVAVAFILNIADSAWSGWSLGEPVIDRAGRRIFVAVDATSDGSSSHDTSDPALDAALDAVRASVWHDTSEYLRSDHRRADPGVDRAVAAALPVATATAWLRRSTADRFGVRPLSHRTPTGLPPAVWWWPHTRFVVVCEPPVEWHVERVPGARPTDEGYRLHREDGPAARWADGYGVYFWHGVAVPADLIERGWDVETIHRHPNSEVRRAAIERIGWAAFIEQAGWRLLAEAPDPGNQPHLLALYEDPQRRLGDVRVLAMTNGSPDRAGTLRRHAETVPSTIDDPVEAAAWQYGCSVEIYRQLQRRT